MNINASISLRNIWQWTYVPRSGITISQGMCMLSSSIYCQATCLLNGKILKAFNTGNPFCWKFYWRFQALLKHNRRHDVCVKSKRILKLLDASEFSMVSLYELVQSKYIKIVFLWTDKNRWRQNLNDTFHSFIKYQLVYTWHSIPSPILKITKHH